MGEMSRVATGFNSEGFYLARGVFGGCFLDQLASEFDRVVDQIAASDEDINARWRGIDESSVVLHTHNVQQYSSLWLRALLHEPFLDVARSILGPDVVLHHTKLFNKPPEVGAPFPMHQDWSYFPTEKDTMLAAVIHVSHATDEMGCLRVVPGSHRLGRLADSGGQEGDFAERHPIEDSIPLEAEAGDVVFFHYLTIHGSKPNVSGITRKTVLAQLHAGEDRVDPACLHPEEQLVLSGWNSRMTRGRADRSD